MQELDLSKMDMKELKALAYDLLVNIQNFQNAYNRVNENIQAKQREAMTPMTTTSDNGNVHQLSVVE